MSTLVRTVKQVKSKLFAFPVYKVSLGKLSATGLSEELANAELDKLVTARLERAARKGKRA